jgi:hypothetical protein
MGLDMYLEKLPRNKTRKQLDAENDEAWAKGIEYWREHIRDVREVAYWRKANWLHGYIVRTFADGVDECQPIELSRNDVEIILAQCIEAADVLSGKRLIPQKENSIVDYKCVYVDDTDKEPFIIDASDGKLKDKAALEAKLDEGYFKVEPSAKEQLDAVLPPERGFFFGSYDYDNYYVWDVFETIEMLEKVLAEWDDNYRYVYQASW